MDEIVTEADAAVEETEAIEVDVTTEAAETAEDDTREKVTGATGEKNSRTVPQ